MILNFERYDEFIGPDFNSTQHSNARYRAYYPIKILNTTFGNHLYQIEVPSRLEVLNSIGEWQPHPVVFINNQFKKQWSNSLILFITDKEYYKIPIDAKSDLSSKIYVEAEKLGLTTGNRENIMHSGKDI